MPPVGAGQIYCPCPQRTCVTTITSTNNNHEIKCVQCSMWWTTYGIQDWSYYFHNRHFLPTSLLDKHLPNPHKDLVWKCSDLEISPESTCPGDATMAPDTEAPGPGTASVPTPATMTTRGGRFLSKDMLHKRVF